MEMQRKKIMAIGEDRLSDLPDSMLIHILSKLPDSKEVVRTSVLSTKWHFLWKSVRVSLKMELSCRNDNPYLASTDRDLHYWRYFDKISTFSVTLFGYKKILLKDVDLCVHFVTNDANVEGFILRFYNYVDSEEYTFPQFAYNNTLLRNLVLSKCRLNPFGNVNWSNLISLSLEYLELTDGSMKRILSGCPNLECLKLKEFYGMNCLEINNVKLREVTIEDYKGKKNAPWLEVFAPHIQKLQLLGYCGEIRVRQRNVDSLVTFVVTGFIRLYDDYEDEEHNLEYFYDDERDLEKECSYLKELLHGVVHVENLELGTWCIQRLSILEWKGWQSPPSHWKFLKLFGSVEPLDFPGICSFLQSSLDLEKLVINWYYGSGMPLARYMDEDEQIRRFETQNFNGSLLHLKTIKIISIYGPLSENKFILALKKYLLKIATVLEKFIIVVRLKASDASPDYVKVKQEFLSFPRSSPHASVVFSYV